MNFSMVEWEEAKELGLDIHVKVVQLGTPDCTVFGKKHLECRKLTTGYIRGVTHEKNGKEVLWCLVKHDSTEPIECGVYRPSEMERIA